MQLGYCQLPCSIIIVGMHFIAFTTKSTACTVYKLFLSSVDFPNFLELPDEKMELQDPEGGIQEPAQSSVYL